MKAIFQIPLLAATGLAGCSSSFDFEGTWNLQSITYDGETTAFPIMYEGYSQSIDMTVNETNLDIVTTYTYANGDPPDVYTEGPYAWSENDDGAFVIDPTDFDAASFICEGTDDDDVLNCTIDYTDEVTDLVFGRE